MCMLRASGTYRQKSEAQSSLLPSPATATRSLDVLLVLAPCQLPAARQPGNVFEDSAVDVAQHVLIKPAVAETCATTGCSGRHFQPPISIVSSRKAKKNDGVGGSGLPIMNDEAEAVVDLRSP
jgi:hypothetical protein